MSSNTGLLTARCDPFGAESDVRLLGGIYPQSHVGRIMWHCDNQAIARFRMICTGGGYGTRIAPDGGIVPQTICDGGHRGQPMPLCADHRVEIQRRQSDLCPRCAWPEEAIHLDRQITVIQEAMQHVHPLDMPKLARLTSEHDQRAARMTEMAKLGIIHKCPLRLTEVS